MGKTITRADWIVGTLVALGGAVVLFVMIAGGSWASPPKTPVERAREACDRQFPSDVAASQSCQLDVLTAGLMKERQDKLARAYRDAR